MLNQKKLTLPPNIGSLNKSGHDMKIALGSEIFSFLNWGHPPKRTSVLNQWGRWGLHATIQHEFYQSARRRIVFSHAGVALWVMHGTERHHIFPRRSVNVRHWACHLRNR